MQRAITVAIPLVLCIAALFALKFFLLDRVIVVIPRDSKNMRPAIGKSTTRFTLDVLAVYKRRLRQGDVVAYHLPQNSLLAGRVIALAGDRVTIKAGHVQVNGREYKPQGALLATRMNLSGLLIPRDCVYLLADVRDKDPDSWKVGPIELRYVLGKIQLGK